MNTSNAGAKPLTVWELRQSKEGRKMMGRTWKDKSVGYAEDVKERAHDI